MKKSFIVSFVIIGVVAGISVFAAGRGRSGGGRGGGRAGSGVSRTSSSRGSSHASRVTSGSQRSSRGSISQRSGTRRSPVARSSSPRSVRSSSAGVTSSRRIQSSGSSSVTGVRQTTPGATRVRSVRDGGTTTTRNRIQTSDRSITRDTLSHVRANSTQGRVTSQRATTTALTGRNNIKTGTNTRRKEESISASRIQQAKIAGKVPSATTVNTQSLATQKARVKTTTTTVTTTTPSASGKTVTTTVTTYSGKYHHYHHHYHDGGNWRYGYGYWGPWGWWGYGYGWAFGVSLWAGVALGISAGYYPGWYWMYPYQTAVWGAYYASPFATGLYYYPDAGYWYYSSMRAWYWPWFGCWYYPSMWTWYYPRVQVSVVSYVDKAQPYVVVDNDTSKEVYYAFYEREKTEDVIAFYRKGLVNKILKNGSRKVYIPKGDSDAFIVASRSQEALRDVVLQSDIDNQQNPLVLIDVSKTKKQTIEAKDLASKAKDKEDQRETEDLTLIREKIREQDQEMTTLSEKIDTSIEKDKDVPENAQEQEEQLTPESVPVPGKKPVSGKEPVKPIKPTKPIIDEETVDAAAAAA